MPHGHVVGVQGDRPVEQGQRVRPVTAAGGRIRHFFERLRVLAVQRHRAIEVSGCGGLVSQLHQVPTGTEVRHGVVGLEGEISVVLGRGLGVAVRLAQLFGQAEAGAGERRVAPQSASR